MSKLTKLSRIIFCIPFFLLLHGCLFVYIPGSMISAVSDSITGDKGKNCVGSKAKVGDYINIAGQRYIVKSLSGESSRCTDERYPIRAGLELDPNQ